MHSDFPALLKVSAGRNLSSHTIAEFASIICTDPERERWTPGAAETRKVQWKGLLVQWKYLPMQRKGLPVQWKAARRAAESWSSHHNNTYRIDCSLWLAGLARSWR